MSIWILLLTILARKTPSVLSLVVSRRLSDENYIVTMFGQSLADLFINF